MSTEGFNYVQFVQDLQLRFDALHQDVANLGLRYRAAKPVPFIVIDDFLPAWIAEAVWGVFPGREFANWTKLPTEDQKGKYALADENRMPTEIRGLIHELNSGSFLRFLEKLTDIPELIADAKLVGGGLHRIERGGKLSVHVDFSHHPTNRLNRRLNFLLYLNKDWKEEYGGHFELWNKDISRCEEKILPIFNRCAIFSTSPFSYHGHPEPLACPEGVGRSSIALYYFSNGRPAEEEGEHNTLFRSRPGDSFHASNFVARMASSGLFRDLMPPLVYRTARKIWNRKFTGA